jgi:23S rRNA (cytidine2498-2'-O)-methyltransferase
VSATSPRSTQAFLVTPGSEPALRDELGGSGRLLAPGVVLAEGGGGAADPVFARQVLPGAREVRGTSVRALAEGAYAAVEAAIDAGSGPFTMHMITPADIHDEIEGEPGLGSRAALVGHALLGLLGERRKRASRRFRPEIPRDDAFDGRWLLVQLLLVGRDHLLASAASPRRLPRGGTDLARWPAGRAPVAIDRGPPSRAYRKLEEAFAWMGAAPAPGELCVDLGAAPGGWTAKVLARGARVVAVDRAPLEIAPHPDLATVIGNAFTYAPPRPADWLLCDVVCAPPRSLTLIDTWLSRGWCRRLVVTVKFKGRAGYGELAALGPIFDRARPAFARVKQLAHNKNEVCVMAAAHRG